MKKLLLLLLFACTISFAQQDTSSSTIDHLEVGFDNGYLNIERTSNTHVKAGAPVYYLDITRSKGIDSDVYAAGFQYRPIWTSGPGDWVTPEAEGSLVISNIGFNRVALRGIYAPTERRMEVRLILYKPNPSIGATGSHNSPKTWRGTPFEFKIQPVGWKPPVVVEVCELPAGEVFAINDVTANGRNVSIGISKGASSTNLGYKYAHVYEYTDGIQHTVMGRHYDLDQDDCTETHEIKIAKDTIPPTEAYLKHFVRLRVYPKKENLVNEDWKDVDLLIDDCTLPEGKNFLINDHSLSGDTVTVNITKPIGDIIGYGVIHLYGDEREVFDTSKAVFLGPNKCNRDFHVNIDSDAPGVIIRVFNADSSLAGPEDWTDINIKLN